MNPTTPHFAALYGLRSGKPNFPAAELRLTMLPPPDARNAGTARRAQANMAARSTRSVSSTSSGVMSSTRLVGPAMPALFTITSSPPSSASAASMNRSRSSVRPASANMPGWPHAVSALAVHVRDERTAAAGDEAVGHHPADAARPAGDGDAQSRQVERDGRGRGLDHGSLRAKRAVHVTGKRQSPGTAVSGGPPGFCAACQARTPGGQVDLMNATTAAISAGASRPS